MTPSPLFFPPHLHGFFPDSAEQFRLFVRALPLPSSVFFLFPLTVKFEEVEQNVPSLPKLRKCASNVYSVEIIKKMELAGASIPFTPPPPHRPSSIVL